MTKKKIKTLLDYLPLLIQLVSTIILIWTISKTNIALTNRHYLGFAVLLLTIGLFSWRHKAGVLSLGLLLLLGLFTIISYSAVTDYYSIGGSINGHSTGDVKIQGIFVLWILLHFIVSGRHYVGILTKAYWNNLLLDKKVELTPTHYS